MRLLIADGPPIGFDACDEHAVKTAHTNMGRGLFKEDKLKHGLMDGAVSGNFQDCRTSDMAQYLHLYALICVLTPKETAGVLPYGLRMRVRSLPVLEMVRSEAPQGPECDYAYESMTPGAREVLADSKALRNKAFRRCREAIDKFMILAKYERFRSCIRELDQKRSVPRGIKGKLVHATEEVVTDTVEAAGGAVKNPNALPTGQGQAPTPQLDEAHKITAEDVRIDTTANG